MPPGVWLFGSCILYSIQDILFHSGCISQTAIALAAQACVFMEVTADRFPLTAGDTWKKVGGLLSKGWLALCWFRITISLLEDCSQVAACFNSFNQWVITQKTLMLPYRHVVLSKLFFYMLSANTVKPLSFLSKNECYYQCCYALVCTGSSSPSRLWPHWPAWKLYYGRVRMSVDISHA